MVPVILDVLEFSIFLDLDSLHDVYVFLSVSYDGKSIPYVLIPSAWTYCNTYCRTAYDVSINDDSWPTEAFELVTGEKSKTLERLDPGATASHTYVLETKTQGRFQGSPAIITYRVPTKTALQEAYSTPIFPLDILAERPPEKKFEWAKRLVAKYGSLVSVVSFVGLFIYLVATPSKSSSKASKKRR